MSMTDEQIIEALEYCTSTKSCEECPICNADNCVIVLTRNALDLIKRQQAEIAKLNIDLDAMRCAANSLKMHYDKAKSEAVWDIATEYDAYREAVEVALVETRAEAVREFAEKLKDIYALHDGLQMEIDNLVREMTEKEGGKG